MNDTIKENSYLFLLGEGEDAKMAALCELCAKKEQKGWFWDGKRLGYGDYDLFCSSCGNTIYLRKKDDKISNKNQ
jgi:hypothetical protein